MSLEVKEILNARVVCSVLIVWSLHCRCRSCHMFRVTAIAAAFFQHFSLSLSLSLSLSVLIEHARSQDALMGALHFCKLAGAVERCFGEPIVAAACWLVRMWAIIKALICRSFGQSVTPPFINNFSEAQEQRLVKG